MSSTQDYTPTLSTPTGDLSTPPVVVSNAPAGDFPVTTGGSTEPYTEVDSKAAEEAIKSIDEQLGTTGAGTTTAGQVPGLSGEKPKEPEVGEKRERDVTEDAGGPRAPVAAGATAEELKGAEEEAGKEVKKAKVADAGDAGTVQVEAAKAGETTEAHPAKGSKRGRGRGGKAAKAAPAQGTRRSTRGSKAAGATEEIVAQVENKAAGVEVGAQPAAPVTEAAAPTATEGAPETQL